MRLRGVVMAGVAAAALAGPAAAQQTERGAFILRMGADTFAVERFTRGPGALEGELSLRPSLRVAWTLSQAADGSLARFEARSWTGAADAPPTQTVTLTVRGDTAHAEMRPASGEAETVAAKVDPGFVPFVNPSALLMEEVLVRARRAGGAGPVSVPLLPVGAPEQRTATVAWIGADSATLTLGPVEVRARVNAAGRMLGAAIPSQNLTIERVAEIPGSVSLVTDYSAPEGAPYTAQEVRVRTPGGFELAGTLTLPKERRGRVPAVITITGSGQQDRDEALPLVRGFRPFRQVADTLGRRGIAVLRLDDRGVGGSGGEVETATTADFADDVRAALAWLRARPEIDPARIALVGHSEGGVIAPMVAAEDPALKAVVLIAGTSRPGRDILAYQTRYGVERDTSIAAEKRDSALAAIRAQVDSMVANVPWFRFFSEYDPLPTTRRVKQPVLILQGATDRQVTADQAEELAAALRAGGNRDVTVRIFPDVNHLMLRDPDGWGGGYTSLPDPNVVPELLGALADWLARKL